MGLVARTAATASRTLHPKESDIASERDKPAPRAQLPGWRGDSIGLLRHSRQVFCDPCDLGVAAPAFTCMALDMLQHNQVALIVRKQLRLRQRNPWSDPSGREARHMRVTKASSSGSLQTR